MRYDKITGIDKPLSKLVYGTATPILFAALSEDAPFDNIDAAYKLLDSVTASGINTFDCAAHYGEQILGRWMEERDSRENCIVITKCAHPNQWRQRVTSFDILADIHDSLKKLRTDYVDIYMLHRDNPEVPVGEIVDTLNKLYDKGMIKVFGGSNWTHERIEAANEYAAKHNLMPFTVSSPNFGLAEQVNDPWVADAKFGPGCVTVSGPENKAARDWYEKNNISVFAYSSLARGLFSGAFKSSEPEKAKQIMDEPGILGYFCDRNIERLKRCEELAGKKGYTVPQIALAWVLNQKMPVFALSSPINAEQLNANSAACDIILTEEEIKYLNLE
ncbi:MAG: aldo/keto reductase [Clostridia bacterium]|nr:aldo/keto reductase [Clostridia bacterium]